MKLGLAEKGQPTALESQARKAMLPVSVDAGGIGRYSQEIEATVYFSVLEALQNVQRYARAARATMRLRESDGSLRFEVEDDGCGFDAATVRTGAGLTNIADWLDSLGGVLVIRSSPGTGATMGGVLPLPLAAGGSGL